MHYLNLVFNFTKKIILIALITFSFTLFIDFFFGKKILSLTDKFWRSTNFYDRLLRVDHDVYHHTLRPNINYNLAQGFDGYFKLCTDNNGFRYKCNPIARSKDFDYAFIGDSFTEGVSLNYEDTFVGIFEKSSNKKIANLGVVSYSPKIYFAKLNDLITNKKYKFKHVIVSIDISDLYDDDVYYVLKENFSVDENYSRVKNLRLRKILRKHFPFTNYYFFVLKQFKTSEEIVVKQEKPIFHSKANLKASWTYSNEELIDGYISTTKKAQTDMINTMNKIYELLKKNSITMSVLIYPWPQQLINNVQESNHEKMWSDFCLNKCENFFNLFPIYKQKLENSNFIEVYKKYYFWNDVHFTKEGNQLIADELSKMLK